MAGQIIQSLIAMVRTLGFALSQMESHWKMLSRQKKVTLASLCRLGRETARAEARGSCCLLIGKRLLPWTRGVVVGGLRKH